MSFAFHAGNAHGPTAGPPPAIETRPGDYFGYFQSQSGAQWIFRVQRYCREGELFGGAIGWEKPRVIQVNAADSSIPDFYDLPLNERERGWLTLCWRMSADVRAGRDLTPGEG